jgi:serine/threonine protein kinase
MSESAQELLNRLLQSADAFEWRHELRAFAKHSPARIAELSARIKAAAHDGLLTPDFAAVALRALAPDEEGPASTQLRDPPNATVARKGAAPEPTQLRTLVDGTALREPTPFAVTDFSTSTNDGLTLSSNVTPAFEKPSHAVALAAGAVVKGRFELEHQIGRGGMGLVFAAIDRRKQEARDPNPHIALKILHGDFQRHQDALMALQREARKAQSLAHPNVVTVFDFDRDGPTVFMTMELLRGRSLDAVIHEVRGTGVGRKAAIPIIRGIAEGLAYAHRKGIVHSDLKPGNVFLLEDGTPKLLDFGIARAVPSANAEQDIFDAGSLGAYTEAYATPEMVEGSDPHTADDVYALGLIVYELLTGAHPYRRHSAAKARALGLKPHMPKELTRQECRVLEAALAFERSKRPKDAAEFLSRFFGATRLQKALVAAVVVLTVLAGVFAYRDYRQSGPTVAFEELAPATQQQFTAAMSVGDTSWNFYARDRNFVALYDAVDAYADAYRLHPRNRKATSALKRSADALLEEVAKTPQQRRELATGLMQKSEFLSKYEPLLEAAR